LTGQTAIARHRWAAEDNSAQRVETLAVIADYNQSQDMTPELDARFGNLARIVFAPIRSLLRCAAVAARPGHVAATANRNPSSRRALVESMTTRSSPSRPWVGLAEPGLCGGALLALILGHARRPSGNSLGGLLISFLLLRSAFLGRWKSGTALHAGMLSVVILFTSRVLADLRRVRRPAYKIFISRRKSE